MTQPIDVAYVDIVARDKSLRTFRSTVDDTFKKLDKDIEEHLDNIDKQLDDSLNDISKHFEKVADNAAKSFDDVADSVEASLSDVDVTIDRHGKRTRSRFAALGAAIGDTFDGIKDRVTKSLGKVFNTLGDGVQSLFGIVGKIGGGLGSLVSSSPLLALIVVLTPAIIALAAALSQLIGLVGILPSGLAVLISAIVPVVVAFQNFGDAVSALASGDLEKIDEALKKLSPSAAFVAREIAALLPVLKSFQRGVQEAFFAQVRGGFTRLINTTLPAIATNFGNIAVQMGTLTGQFVSFLTSANAIETFNDLFAATARIIDRIGEPIIRFLDAIASSVSASLPFVERLAVAFGNALDKFSGFINQAIESGAFNEFIEDAFTTVKELIDLVKALGGLLGTIFAGTEESGHELIKTLTDMVKQLDDFFKTAQGQAILSDLADLVGVLGFLILAAANALIFLDQQFRVSLLILESIGLGFFDLINAIGSFFGQLFDFLGTLPERLTSSLGAVPAAVSAIFQQTVDGVTGIVVNGFNTIVDFISGVPGRIAALAGVFLNAGRNLITSFMNGFRSVGSFIGDIAGDIVGSVRSFLNRAIDKINSGIGALDALLPGTLARIPRLAQGAVIRNRPGGILANIGEGNEDEVVAPLSTLEDIIRKAFGGDGPSGMTVNFGPGSINISFSGAVPTEGEARAVGSAVGEGIANKLATRNVRTQLRTV